MTPLYGLENRYMALKPLKPLYGLEKRYMALGWPRRSASDNLNIAKCPWRKVWTKFIIWPLRSLYGLWGRYMTLEVIIRPWGQYMALDDLRGRPQMTSILLSARDEKFGWNSLYGLWGRYMTLEVIIWPWRSIYGLGGQYMALDVNIWPWRSASDDLWGQPL